MMASITSAWENRFGLFQGLHQVSHDNSVVRGLKKKSQEAVSRAAYFCAEEHQRRMGVEIRTDGERDFVGLSSLFPAKDQVGTFIGYPDRDGRATNIGDEDTEVFPLLRVGSSSYYIGIADIIGERDWLRENIRQWEIYDKQRTADLDWLTELGGCGTPEDWFVDDDGNEGGTCVAVQQWAQWKAIWMEHHSLSAPGVVPANWWELVDLYDNEVSKAHAAQDLAEIEKDRALAEVETQKAACKNSWAAQKERDESAMAEISQLAEENKDLKREVEDLKKRLSIARNRFEMAEDSRIEAAEACEAIQKKNRRLQQAIKEILSSAEGVYEEDE